MIRLHDLTDKPEMFVRNGPLEKSGLTSKRLTNRVHAHAG